jgi:hypothetical protein
MRSRLSLVFFGLSVLVLVCSAAAPAAAWITVAPEIDANSMAAGLGLLGAGVMMLGARRRRK